MKGKYTRGRGLRETFTTNPWWLCCKWYT